MRGLDAATWLSLTAATLGSGCAGAFSAPEPPTPDQIPALEIRHAERPADADVATRLAAAYREAGRVEEAVGLLESTLASNPDHEAAVYYLGLAYEEVGADSSALALYRRYLELDGDADLRNELERRVGLIRRAALRESVLASLAREAELAATPPRPRTIAVFPFPYLGADPGIRSLGRALAQMLVTDLSQTDRLDVLERLQVQYLAEEISLAEQGRVDPATAARGGRVLGAERVVQGQIDGTVQEIVLDAAVIRTSDGADAAESVGSRDQLARFFDLEKEMALAIYEAAGVQLTPAERERVLQRQTENLEAILAFGLGLEAQDAGRYQEAANHFSRAATLDPSFDLAASASSESNTLAAAAAVEVQSLATLGGERLMVSQAYADWLRRQVDFLQVEGLLPGSSERDAVSEFIGTEGFSESSAVLEIILDRPGGAP
jgi:tetratricopeptide (TPR) repeat protein